MAVAGQIRFCSGRVRIEQTPHPLDQIEIEFSDSVDLQPSLDDAPLERPWLCAECGRVELLGFELFGIDQSLDPFCLICGNERRPPQGCAHFSAELLFDVGDEPTTHPITHRAQTLVADVFSILQPSRLYILIDFLAPNAKQGSNNPEFGPRHATRTNLAHAAKAGRPGAAKQIHQESLNEIIRVVAEENRLAPSAPRDACKKFVTRHASRRFQRLFRSAGQRAHIRLIDLELTMKPGSQTFDELRIGLARATAQLMIEMADDEAPVAKIEELMQQGDRIAAAGDADEVSLLLRKLRENL